MNSCDAIKLNPAFKDYLWGGTKLKESYNKKSDLDIVAESWELSTHKDGESVVADGEFKGLSFSEYIKLNEYDVLGEDVKKFDNFPVLIKFIDAKKSLSIQVHPDDEYALKNNNEYGKTEMWYIVDCDEDAYIYYGFTKDITKEEFRERIENNTLLEVLNKVMVKKGDVYFIEAGTVHAIGEGNLICEIQQNSNSTYRVYDYNRKDVNGNTRELHIDKAIDVSKTEKPKTYERLNENDLASCKYFDVKKASVKNEFSFNITKDSFVSVIVVDGEGLIEVCGKKIDFIKGDSIFIPAQDAKVLVLGNCELILTRV